MPGESITDLQAQMICLVISLSIPGPVHTELGGEQIWRKHGILGREPGESQCLGVRQTAGTAAKTKQLYITFQLFRHQELHHIEELCAV